MDFITGPSQAASDAAAVLKPTYFKKSRRVVDESSRTSLSPKKSPTGISSTNSDCFKVSTTELVSNYSTLFQYFLFDAILLIDINYFIINSDIYHIPNHPFERL
jgi:hypothetical protein